jgi:hypothetical protein
MRTIAIVLLLTGAAAASAGEYQPLHGTYKLGGKTLIDPPATESQTTHFYVDLQGRTAHDLYDALDAKPVAGVCGEPGDLTKRSGGVQCTKAQGGKAYYCAFGIELKTQKVVSGVVC